MTADCVAYHALTRPEAVAVIHDGRRITYADFHRDIHRFTRAARELGVRPGGAVAVGCEDFYTHWLVLLAFESLGIATASLAPRENSPSTEPLLASMDLILSDTELSSSAPIRRIERITPAWLARTRNLEPPDDEPRVPRSPADVIRILRTSGTTGAPKRMLLRRRMHEARLANWTCFGISREHRFLALMPFTVHAVYSTATAYIRAGATVVHEGRREPGAAVVEHDIDHVILMPKQLRLVLDQLPADGARPRGLTISSLGAVLPAALRARALSRIAADVLDLYACNEVATVAVRRSDSGADGALWPGIDVEIVDQSGRPLRAGQAGVVRIATESMVEGYLDDAETTTRMFRDGWFYPGDVGVLHGARRLQVLGRADELLNVGGEKLSPMDLEEQIMAEAGIDDVGVCTIADAEAVERLCVAVSGAVAADTEALARIGKLATAGRTDGVFVVAIPRIPRTPTGKIQRALLKTAALEAARLAGAV